MRKGPGPPPNDDPGPFLSVSCLGVPALRPGVATDKENDAAPRRQAHEGSPLPGPWFSTPTPWKIS